MEVTGTKDGRSVSRRSKKSNGGGRRGKPAVLTETERLIAVLKENKIEHYKSEALEIKFSMMAFLPNLPENPSSEVSNKEDTDELLYYSAQRG